MHFLLSIISVLSIKVCLAQITDKTCDEYNVKIVPYFDIARYIGKWYEYGRYEGKHLVDFDCVVVEYYIQDDKLGFLNKEKHLASGNTSEVQGVLQQENPEKIDGALKLHVIEFDLHMDHWVIGTDYDNYAVVWSCDGNRQDLYLASRTPVITDEVKRIFSEIMTDAGIDQSKIRLTVNDPVTCEHKVE